MGFFDLQAWYEYQEAVGPSVQYSYDDLEAILRLKNHVRNFLVVSSMRRYKIPVRSGNSFDEMVDVAIKQYAEDKQEALGLVGKLKESMFPEWTLAVPVSERHFKDLHDEGWIEEINGYDGYFHLTLEALTDLLEGELPIDHVFDHYAEYSYRYAQALAGKHGSAEKCCVINCLTNFMRYDVEDMPVLNHASDKLTLLEKNLKRTAGYLVNKLRRRLYKEYKATGNSDALRKFDNSYPKESVAFDRNLYMDTRFVRYFLIRIMDRTEIMSRI